MGPSLLGNERIYWRNTHPWQQACTLDTGIRSKAPTMPRYNRKWGKKSLENTMVTITKLGELEATKQARLTKKIILCRTHVEIVLASKFCPSFGLELVLRAGTRACVTDPIYKTIKL